MKVLRKSFLSLLLIAIVFLLASPVGAADLKPVQSLEQDYKNAIDNTITWLKQGHDTIVFSEVLQSAGATEGDWAIFGAARSGYQDNYQAYLDALETFVTEKYRENDGLDVNKATEWHRIALTVLALGGDPIKFGTDLEGNPVNLIEDGVYNPVIDPVWGRQGMNGAIFALLALDAKKYDVPDSAAYDRDDYISYLLSRELSGGGFNLNAQATVMDPDITGMTLQALAPYYSTNSEVKAAVERSLSLLSSAQRPDGDFATYGTENLESTVQVFLAICALGIDPLTDSRFIKNGNTLLDAIEKYYNSEDGGFIHAFVDDPSAGAAAGESNGMATDQGRYALVAYDRFVRDLGSLYDFTDSGNNDYDPSTLEPIDMMTDVPKSEWYYAYVAHVLKAGIFNGKSATTFAPSSNITRGEFITILGRYAGIQDASSSNPGSTTFADVDATLYYASHIAWGVSKNIVNGISETAYDPNANITREQMAAMVARFAAAENIALADGSAEPLFTDDDQIASYAKEAVYDMKASGILSGMGNNDFVPAGTAERAQAAKIMTIIATME